MSVKKYQDNNYKISNISIKDNLLSWEMHSVPVSGITQIWAGIKPAAPFPFKLFLILLFIALSAQTVAGHIAMLILFAFSAALWLYYHRPDKNMNQLNIKLLSGDVITFTSSDEESLDSFYRALQEFLSRRGSSIEFDADGKKIETVEIEPVKESSGIMGMDKKSTSNNPLVNDLRKLYLGYSKKSDTNSEILHLIDNTARLIETDDKEGLKSTLREFISQGLIGECNELGLDSLIQEIKNNIY